MNKIHLLMALNILVFVLSGCESSSEPETAKSDVSINAVEENYDDSLNTGIYLVNRWTIEPGALDPLFEEELFVEYREDKFLELQDDEPEPAKYLALHRTAYIPLDLAKTPDRTEGSEGRAQVALTFSPGMSSRLRDFSRRYLGRQIALVIDGEVITIHKVRSVISGNSMTISRCTDDGCELILAKLAK